MRNSNISSSIVSLCFILISAFSAMSAAAQKKSPTGAELIFSDDDFQHVLAAARSSHKKIFVDAYATWCAPCKMLQLTTFKDARAAAYFNQHFVNISIDVEKGEGIDLAKTWQIEGLPALLILDESGKIMATHIGYVDGRGLLKFAKEASGK